MPFLSEQHGLSKKPAFIGMSRGGEFAYTWATIHPDKVSCIYADNPGPTRRSLPSSAIGQKRRALLQICGSIDPLLGKTRRRSRTSISSSAAGSP